MEAAKKLPLRFQDSRGFCTNTSLDSEISTLGRQQVVANIMEITKRSKND
jgi:hypothetical protein